MVAFGKERCVSYKTVSLLLQWHECVLVYLLLVLAYRKMHYRLASVSFFHIVTTEFIKNNCAKS